MAVTDITTGNATARISQGEFSEPGVTDAIRVSGGIVVQLSGAGTAVNAVVERSTVDPQLRGSSPNWVRIDDTAISGNPSTGITAVQYMEPAIAWWRVRLVSNTGPVFVSISGKV